MPFGGAAVPLRQCQCPIAMSPMLHRLCQGGRPGAMQRKWATPHQICLEGVVPSSAGNQTQQLSRDIQCRLRP